MGSIMLTDKEVFYFTNLCKADENTYPAGVFKINKETFKSILKKSKNFKKELEKHISYNKSFKTEVNFNKESATLVGIKVDDDFSSVIYGNLSCKEYTPIVFLRMFDNKKPFLYNDEIFEKSIKQKKPYFGISSILIEFKNQDINKISSVYIGLKITNIEEPLEKKYNIFNLYKELLENKEKTERLLLSGKNFYKKTSNPTFDRILNFRKEHNFINSFRKSFVTDNDNESIYIMGVENDLSMHVSFGNQKRSNYALNVMMKFVLRNENNLNYSLKLLKINYSPILFLKIRINEGNYTDELTSISKKYPNLSSQSVFCVECISGTDFLFARKMLMDYLKENNMDISNIKEEDLKLLEMNSNEVTKLFEIIQKDWLFYLNIQKTLKEMIAAKKLENEWFYNELKNVIENKTTDESDEEMDSYIDLMQN